ncbi:MAG: M20/M25/M40 family metallo-hydrolase [Candidatus Koribacter versatilis]|uniref:Carboxypeptidase Q n=1 Tax=Candidatus Korobacter versatilis TaxID=658062 RepID=A0A932EQ32_9BACT|nr:M20/M25/M40 family metallo-hydrolase [Candidatus Koribacter versatilis]
MRIVARKTCRPLLCVALALSLALPAGAIEEIDHLIIVAQKAPTLEKNLRALTDEVGGRVPGTPNMEQAFRWALAAFKDAGADSVTTEEFTMPVGWSEGATRVEVTAPTRFTVRSVSVAWSPPIAQTLHARVADVGEGTAADFAKAGDLMGAIVLVHSKVLRSWEDLFAEYSDAPPVIAAAKQANAAAIAWTSTREHDILYRHINSQDGEVDVIPQVLLAREDALRIQRLIAGGAPVEMEITLPNRIGDTFRSANIVAEVKGREKPEEYVVLGAHLDSWELGTGALDNGCNSALVIEALRAIKASGLRPRRSIRFVLFSGEEQGMLGSRAFVQQHRAEMDNVVANITFDEGTGHATGFSLGGRKDIDAKVRAMMAPFAKWGIAKNTTDAFVGTDNLDFLLEGVPTLVANQVEANYLENYHAASDTFDKVDIPQLKKHVALAAAMAFAIANDPQRLGKRQSRAEVEKLLHDTKLDKQLKLFGLWTDWESGKRGREK